MTDDEVRRAINSLSTVQLLRLKLYATRLIANWEVPTPKRLLEQAVTEAVYGNYRLTGSDQYRTLCSIMDSIASRWPTRLSPSPIHQPTPVVPTHLLREVRSRRPLGPNEALQDIASLFRGDRDALRAVELLGAGWTEGEIQSRLCISKQEYADATSRVLSKLENRYRDLVTSPPAQLDAATTRMLLLLLEKRRQENTMSSAAEINRPLSAVYICPICGKGSVTRAQVETTSACKTSCFQWRCESCRVPFGLPWLAGLPETLLVGPAPWPQGEQEPQNVEVALQWGDKIDGTIVSVHAVKTDGQWIFSEWRKDSSTGTPLEATPERIAQAREHLKARSDKTATIIEYIAQIVANRLQPQRAKRSSASS